MCPMYSDTKAGYNQGPRQLLPSQPSDHSHSCRRRFNRSLFPLMVRQEKTTTQ